MNDIDYVHAMFYNSLGAVVKCNRNVDPILNNWQLAHHPAKLTGDIIAPGRELEIWQPLCMTSKDRSPRLGNKSGENNKNTHTKNEKN